MNHPYLYPDECPWLPDYHELQALRTGRPLPPLDDDQSIHPEASQEDYDDDASLTAW